MSEKGSLHEESEIDIWKMLEEVKRRK